MTTKLNPELKTKPHDELLEIISGLIGEMDELILDTVELRLAMESHSEMVQDLNLDYIDGRLEPDAFVTEIMNIDFEAVTPIRRRS